MNAGLNDASVHHNMKGKKDITQIFNFITTQIRFNIYLIYAVL